MDMNVNTEISKKQTEGKNTETAPTPIGSNPYFRRPNRGAYEIGRLLRQMPAHFYPREAVTPDVLLQADATRRHAWNSIYTLTHGLEAIGNLLTTIGCASEERLDNGTLLDLGALITHMAVDLQFLDEVQGSMDEVLSNTAQSSAKEAA